MIIGVVGSSGYHGGSGKSNSSCFLVKKSAMTAIHSACFHGFDAPKTPEMIEPCHLSLKASR
jgi:cyclic lactone autoinducer peptide